MKTWMNNHKVLAMLIILVLSSVLIPTLLVYMLLESTFQVLDMVFDQLDDWWNE